VVVTGMGGLCPLGDEWKVVRDALRSGRSGVRRMPEWDEIEGLETRLGGVVSGFESPAHWPRKKTRSMGRVSLLATRATERALEQAGLLGSPVLESGRAGLAYGSTTGSKPAMGRYVTTLFSRHTTKGVLASDYIQLMSHTTSTNLAQFFGIRGRHVPTTSACTSGSQGIGFAYETVRCGLQDVMIAGGAEELDVMDAAVFDIMFSASRRNDDPGSVPRPFDLERDGLVVAEGAASLVLEELEHARARNAPILAELVGFGTNCDGKHVTNPDPAGMQGAMELALADAGIEASLVDYVCAHGTATELGDIAETTASERVYGSSMPISSLKSYFGHTLGACGAIEAWLSIEMMREGWFAPTLHLANVDPRCGRLDYLRGEPREIEARYVASNNFAFGGVNTSLVFRRWEE
jgi:3-oxoacyl-[acyl-carrier-protein] synthase II